MAILDPEQDHDTGAAAPQKPVVASVSAAPKRRRHLRRLLLTPLYKLAAGIGRFLDFTIFSSLTRRIMVLNLAGLLVLVVGILYLNQWRAGLIEARV